MKLSAICEQMLSRSASKLLGGNAAAQLVFIASTPILTRLYTPEDFSGLAVYIAIIVMGMSISCLKLDVAIPIANTTTDAKNLLFLSCVSSLIFGVLFFGLAILVVSQLPEFNLHLNITYQVLMAPVGICLGGIFSAVQYWAVRQEKFFAIGSIRVFQALLCVLAQIAIGVLFLSSYGLIVGHLFIPFCGVLFLLIYFWKMHELMSFSIPSRGLLLKTFRRFDRFPKFAVVADMVNNAGLHLPIMIIAAFVSPLEGGLLFLAMRVIGTPVSIVSVSIGQLYLSKLNRLETQKRTKGYTLSICRNILHFLLLPLAFSSLFTSDIFGFLFGEEWRRAGFLIIFMLPWFVFQSLSSPISNLLYAQQKQSLLFGLSIFGLCVRVVPLLFCINISPGNVINVFLSAATIHYLVSLTIYLSSASIPIAEIVRFYFYMLLKIGIILGLAIFFRLSLGLSPLPFFPN